MSIEALTWAFNLAPVPTDAKGKPSSSCAAVLQGLANHADAEGIGAFPSVALLVRYTRLSERTVRDCLDRLAAAGIIRPCDPEIVKARIRRADRRPQGWDLDLTLIRDDLTEADIASLERQFPGLRARIEALSEGVREKEPAAGGGVQPAHPVPDTPVTAVPDGVQQPHPAEATGCNQRTDGVQLTQPRGAAVAPEPYIEPSREPSRKPPAANAGARETARRAGNPAAGGGDPLPGMFFDVLGPAWPLSTAQRERLAPAVAAALGLGWEPKALAAYVGANTTGVRSPYAVLERRLKPEELPEPPGPDQQPDFTRRDHVQGDAGRPYRGTGPGPRMSTGDRRQREIDELEARMFGTVRGVPVSTNPPEGTVIRLVPEWADTEKGAPAP